MALLNDTQRAEERERFSQLLSDVFEPVGLTKADIRAALNAADQWVSDNQISYNNALPNPFKNTATSSQKARLLTLIITRRFIEGVN